VSQHPVLISAALSSTPKALDLGAYGQLQLTSNITHCSSGVPQASVLVPILFSIYTSPIDQVVRSYNISLQQYADDTLVYLALSASNFSTGISKLEDCLSSLHAWFCHNGMCLNPTKSEATLIVLHNVCSLSPLFPVSLLHLPPSLPQIR